MNPADPVWGRLNASAMARVLDRARDRFTAEDGAVIFYDLTLLKKRIEELRRLFPADTLHAIAVKANPLTAILQRMHQWGAGLEAATLPELYLGQKAGVPPAKLVFDSPVKTRAELEYALDLGVHINIDSLEELRRVDALLQGRGSRSTIGLRINPQVGSGRIAITSVADEYSKFGVPITEFRDELLSAYQRHEWLKGIHLHIGSQGTDLGLLLRGVEVAADFARSLPRPIEIFDIGGGLPAAYREDERPPTPADYAAALKKQFPELLSAPVRLVTEFGRAVHANAGWTVSRVEILKRVRNVDTAMLHVGADLLLRRCYMPQDWYHEITIVDRCGRPKTGLHPKKVTFAGPLCFAGDLISQEIECPPVEEGDYVLIHDTGAYTLGMWSRHNSRQVPRVLGYEEEGERFYDLKARETLEEVHSFWS